MCLRSDLGRLIRVGSQLLNRDNANGQATIWLNAATNSAEALPVALVTGLLDEFTESSSSSCGQPRRRNRRRCRQRQLA